MHPHHPQRNPAGDLCPRPIPVKYRTHMHRMVVEYRARMHRMHRMVVEYWTRMSKWRDP